MADIKFNRSVTMTGGAKFAAEDLSRFLVEISAAGMLPETTTIRWKAYAGDERDPATITFTATEESA